MRILHVISQKPSFTGSGTYYSALINESIKNNSSFFMCYGVSSKDIVKNYFKVKENCLVVEFESPDLNFPIPGMSDTMPYESSIFSKMTSQEIECYFRTWKRALKQAIEKFQPQIIWAHHLWITTALLKELTNIPVIAFCHGSDLLQTKKSKSLFKTILPSLEKINLVISTSPSQRSEITSLIDAQNIIYIGNGIRSDIFFLNEGLYEENGYFKVVYAGKLSKEKGVHCLIEAIKQLINSGSKIKLTLIGNGSHEEVTYLKSLANEFKKSIHFIGAVNQNELARYFNNTDLFVLPSFYEGLGLVALEAIACGCNIITTNLPNLLSVIPEKAFTQKIVSKISLPNIHNKIELNDLLSFCQELQEAIVYQMRIYRPKEMRKIISELAKDFTYSEIYRQLNLLSAKLIQYPIKL